ncbi:hypothetical protein OAB00_00295 [Akkermansiaceae bacterium]|nr:hypothetical protein [Akkermansiaceae bacterium]
MIHRLHSLGATQLSYRNASVGIIEDRVYPMHVANIDEKTTNSLSGDQSWDVSDWAEGWGIVNEETQKASLNFRSRKGDLFHTIRLTEYSKWDCLGCLLRLFEDSTKIKRRIIPTHKIYGATQKDFAQPLIHILRKHIHYQKTIKCTLFTSGGIVSRKYDFTELKHDETTVKLCSPDAQLFFDLNRIENINLGNPSYVNEDSEKQETQFRGEIYDNFGKPQLIFEAC